MFENVHISDIFALAVSSKAVLSASGSQDILVHDLTSDGYPLKQSIPHAHDFGIHHMCASADGSAVASAGFDGKIKVWAPDVETGDWKLWRGLEPGNGSWAIALSSNAAFIASTTADGGVEIWDINKASEGLRITELKTSGVGEGSFGICVDVSSDGRFTASGHENGAIYVYNNDDRKLHFSLSGSTKPVRQVAFSPGCSRLAAAGDLGIISIHELEKGEQVHTFTGHSAWIMTLSWNHNGNLLLSASFDGKVRVWSIERQACVATHSETSGAIWAARWLPRTSYSATESFVTGGEDKALRFYRETASNGRGKQT